MRGRERGRGREKLTEEMGKIVSGNEKRCSAQEWGGVESGLWLKCKFEGSDGIKEKGT